MAKSSSILYGILKPVIRWGSNLFLKRRAISGRRSFPTNAPVILISNHQNAMLDPVLICIYAPKQLHWLTRADVFKNPLARKFLTAINMLPIYRERDGIGDMRGENIRVFEECFKRLQKNAVIAMFPEGTHRGKKQLIAFKKGLSRLAFGAVESYKDLESLQILPVALDYSDFYNYHPEYIVEYGKPIAISDYLDLYKADPNKAINQLQKDAKEALSNLIVDIQNDERYETIIALRDLVFHLSPEKNLKTQFSYYRSVTKALDSDKISDESFAILSNYVEQLNAQGLKETDESEIAINAVRLLALGLFTPVYLLARTFFLPIEKFVESFVEKNIKDLLFRNSIRMAFWTFITPLYLLVIGVIIKIFAGCTWLEWLSGLGLIAVSGVIAIHWLRAYRKWQNVSKWMRLAKKDDNRFRIFANQRLKAIALIQALIK